MPRAVAIDLLVARGDDIAVWVAEALAYPTGVAFGLVIVRRYGPSPERRHRPWFIPPGEPDGPRFAIGFADGRRTAIGRPFAHGDDRTPDIVLSHNGGGGSDRRWTGRMWLWPLPPAGPLTLAFIWPELKVPETTVEIDSTPIRDAAAQAVELWPEERPHRPPRGEGGWASYTTG